jgi:hypothetical protein
MSLKVSVRLADGNFLSYDQPAFKIGHGGMAFIVDETGAQVVAFAPGKWVTIEVVKEG